MSSKSTPRSATPSSGGDLVRDSAHQIWLAGLGAFTKAQQEGGKVFDALVQEGLTMQRKAQTTAEAKLAEASQKMSSMAQEIGTRATGQWDKLEGLFEERVARALQRLGIPSAQQVLALERRIETLEQQLKASAPARKATPARKAAPAKKSVARKASRKA
jgi:poly(hydroxyalkanoate) granule-associated protein